MIDYKKLAQRIAAAAGVLLIIMGLGCGIAVAAMESEMQHTKDDLWLACERLAWYQSQPQELPTLTIPLPTEDTMPMRYAGEFEVTANCCEAGCAMCGGTGITASGAPQVAGVTAGANFDTLPAGTWIYIEGVGIRQVQDTGAGCPADHIDVAVETHAEALRWAGYGTHKVWILQEANYDR